MWHIHTLSANSSTFTTETYRAASVQWICVLLFSIVINKDSSHELKLADSYYLYRHV